MSDTSSPEITWNDKTEVKLPKFSVITEAFLLALAEADASNDIVWFKFRNLKWIVAPNMNAEAFYIEFKKFSGHNITDPRWSAFAKK